MKKLSEIIKTDCYIDCGTNEKLREVVSLIKLPENTVQQSFGLRKKDTYLLIFKNRHATFTHADIAEFIIHHISEIDLNN